MLDGCRCGNVFAAVTGCLGLVYRGAKLSAEAHDGLMLEPCRASSTLLRRLASTAPTSGPPALRKKHNKAGPSHEVAETRPLLMPV